MKMIRPTTVGRGNFQAPQRLVEMKPIARCRTKRTVAGLAVTGVLLAMGPWPSDAAEGTPPAAIAAKATEPAALRADEDALRRKAGSGDREAQFALGLKYDLGQYRSSGKSEAVRWYKAAAEQGHSTAALNLGILYEDGQGIARDARAARYWYRRAHVLGDTRAVAGLSRLDEMREGAATWYDRAGNQRFGDDAVQSLPASKPMVDTPATRSKDALSKNPKSRKTAEPAKSAPEALHLARASEKAGRPDAEAVATDLYRAAAELGSAEGAFNLAYRLSRGLGAPRDDAEALRWYREAAEKGHLGAVNNLGFMIALGRGAPRNDSEALMWFRAAAGLEYGPAQTNLGLMFDTGRGVERSRADAIWWWSRAASNGYAPAAERLNTVREAAGDGRPQTVLSALWRRISGEPRR